MQIGCFAFELTGCYCGQEACFPAGICCRMKPHGPLENGMTHTVCKLFVIIWTLSISTTCRGSYFVCFWFFFVCFWGGFLCFCFCFLGGGGKGVGEGDGDTDHKVQFFTSFYFTYAYDRKHLNE